MLADKPTLPKVDREYVWFSKWLFFSFFFWVGIYVTIFVFLSAFFLFCSSFSRAFFGFGVCSYCFNDFPAAFDSFFIYSNVFSFKFVMRFCYFYENSLRLNLEDFDEVVFLSKLIFIFLFDETDDLLECFDWFFSLRVAAKAA